MATKLTCRNTLNRNNYQASSSPVTVYYIRFVTRTLASRLNCQELKIHLNVKSFIPICVVGVSSIGIASAKSYYFTLSAPTKAGATTLKPGDYEVDVKGTQAVFRDNGGKSVSIPVKVEQSDKKFDNTAVETSSDTIQEIDLGGSTTKLTFGQ
jgi:hypothetical protein